MKYCASILLFIAILFTSISGYAEEKYADVEISTVPHWMLTLMETFSGTVPSRAWIFEKNDAEVFVSVMVTEGVSGGLEGQDLKKIAKQYMHSFVGGWGGRLNGPEEGSLATFCGGEPGYKGEAQFGESKFDYYGCIRVPADLSRMVSIVTWVAPGTPESVAASRLMTYIEAVKFLKSDDTNG